MAIANITKKDSYPHGYPKVDEVTTDGCGCCSESYALDSDEALEEALNTAELIIIFCELRKISMRNLMKEARERIV